MKALIISEDKELIDFYTNIFEKNRIDVIRYKWPLKAMDNVEEIKPDFIVVSTVEYPRHWKTLARYVKSDVIKKAVYFILQIQTNFPDDERQKAETLGINSFVSSFSDYFKAKISNKIKDFIVETTELTPAPVSQPQPVEKKRQPKTDEDGLFSVDMIVSEAQKKDIECPGFYMLSSPVTGKAIYGQYLEYNGKKITCKVDDMEDFCGIDSSCFIKYVTFYNKNECKSFSADVNEYLDISEQKFIVLDICDFYEEK